MHDIPLHKADDAGHHGHHDTNYVAVWALLLVLLTVSVIGPMFEIPTLTLVTAFGIAIVKAYLVAKHFMHLMIERKYIIYLLSTMLLFMFVFVAGTSPDVLKHEGQNWENTAAKHEVDRVLSAEGAGAHAHGHH